MGNNTERYCQITFMDGEQKKFFFEAVRPENDPTMKLAIHEMINQKNLIFQLDERMVVIPMNNVRSIDVYPAPEVLPEWIIRATENN
jgi:hypothetical protein